MWLYSGSTGSSFSLLSAPFRATFFLILSWQFQIIMEKQSRKENVMLLNPVTARRSKWFYLLETACGIFQLAARCHAWYRSFQLIVKEEKFFLRHRRTGEFICFLFHICFLLVVTKVPVKTCPFCYFPWTSFISENSIKIPNKGTSLSSTTIFMSIFLQRHWDKL